MKRFKRHLTLTMLVFSMLLTHASTAFGETYTQQADSIEISLLTCGPRPNVYSLYGHTAIRYTDRGRGIDVAINYGMFSFDKPFFILRFVFGLTDYEMGIEDFADFASHYEPSGCGIRQQTLNLSSEEKEKIANAISTNYLPQNRVYRYNYFYDNCTTRARDIIVKNINGKIEYSGNTESPYPSFRASTHAYNQTHRWARFGNDLLLGVKADMPTSFAQHQFLPETLSRDFENASITDEHGNIRRLVTNDFWVTPRTNGVGSDKFPLSPMASMCIISLLVLTGTAFERYRHKIFWGIDIVAMSITGICGIILFAMIFSQHPTVSVNLQILFLNPLNLVFMPSTIKGILNKRLTFWLKAWTCLLAAFIICGILQSYAEGLAFVASSLLLRNINTINIIRNRAVKAANK